MLRRLAMLVVTLIAVTWFTTLLISFVPGDTADAIAPFSSTEQRAKIRSDLHLDEPVIARYWGWLSDIAHGNLGRVYTGPTSSAPVADKVLRALPNSLRLMAYSMVLALVIAVPLGVFTAYRASSLTDRFASSTTLVFLAVPEYVLGLVLVYYLGVRLGAFPVTYDRSLHGLDGHIRNYFLPTVCLAAGQVAIYQRLLRNDMIATLREDFVLMARSKGIPPRRILWRHALRPSSLTLLTIAGLNIGTLIGGAIVIEYVFNMPGMGFEIQSAIAGRQYAALQTYVALIAVGYILVNALVDVLYAVLDPRIRRGVVSR